MADTKDTKAETKATKDEAPKATVDSMTNPEGVDLTKGDKNAEPVFSED